MNIRLLLLVLLLPLISCHENNNDILTQQLIEKHTDKIFDELVEIRRNFHRYPELAGNEVRTSEFIISYLTALGMEVKTNIGGYGVVGILHGDSEGKRIAWRADMDALSQNFDLPHIEHFASTVEGVQHGCGHDFHMAIGLGIANVLSAYRDSFEGTVYFVFQPSEETFEGAKAMIGDGLFEITNPDEMYGLHISPFPSGTISAKPEEMFAYPRRFRIRFRNELAEEEIENLIEIIRMRLTRVTHNSEPWNIQLMTHAEAGLENPNTIFQNYRIVDEHFFTNKEQDTLILEAYLYETESSHLDSITGMIQQYISESHYSDHLISVEYIQEHPTVFNDIDLTTSALAAIGNKFGEETVRPNYGQIPYFNEDFAYYQQHVPGVIFFLGGSNSEKDNTAMPHSPIFSADEESIKSGVKIFSSFLLERLHAE